MSLDVSPDLTEEILASKLDPITPFAVSLSASGTLITPASGSRLQVRWLWAQAGAANSAAVVVTFSGSVLGDIYIASLEASQPFAHSAVIDLATNETLDISLSAAETVIVNVDYREVP